MKLAQILKTPDSCQRDIDRERKIDMRLRGRYRQTMREGRSREIEKTWE